MKLKNILVGVLSVFMLTAAGMQPVWAADPICDAPDGQFSAAQKEAAGCGANKNVSEVANEIIQLVIGMVGMVAVGVMVYGGISYGLSTGDASKAAKARRVIMYGLIGLAVALLAFAIVRFVPTIFMAG